MLKNLSSGNTGNKLRRSQGMSLSRSKFEILNDNPKLQYVTVWRKLTETQRNPTYLIKNFTKNVFAFCSTCFDTREFPVPPTHLIFLVFCCNQVVVLYSWETTVSCSLSYT
jgi:hypothetical protein